MEENATGAGEELSDVEENECPESRQLHIIHLIVENVVKKVANSVSFEKIIDIVKSTNENINFTKKDLRSFQKSHSKIQKSLEEVMKNDLDKYIDDSGINNAYEAISKLPPQKSTTASSWKPTGDPRQDMRSHEAENEIKYNCNLQEMVQELEAQKQYLMQQISHQRLVADKVKKELSVLKKDCFTLWTSELAMVKQLDDVAQMQTTE